MWAQRAIVYTKCTALLKAKRLYYRQATLRYEDLDYHNFEPEFDLATTIQQIIGMRSYSAQAMEEIDNYKLLTYEEAMARPYTHH